MAELTIWWVIRLLLIGILIGIVLTDVLFIQPILQDWRACIDGWEATYDVLQQCVATCNSTICESEPLADIGEVVQV